MAIITANRVTYNSYLDTAQKTVTDAYDNIGSVLCGYGELTDEQDKKIRKAHDRLLKATSLLRCVREFSGRIKFTDEIEYDRRRNKE